jgi:hypothetical protein
VKTVGLIVLAIMTGLIAGLVLSEIIGIVGVLVFGAAVGVRFLPFYLAAGCVVAALLISRHRDRAGARRRRP